MTIDFNEERWAKVKENARKWWAGDLGRPLVHAALWGYDSDMPEPSAPVLTQANCHDFSVAPEALAERAEYDLGTRKFLGDGFPCMDTSAFGPGVAAAFMGARLDNSTGAVWFHPDEEREIADVHLQYIPDNMWLERLKAIYAAAAERFEGRVQVSMTDLGGNLDVLSTFRPGEGLLMDLLMEADEVKRVTWESHDLWFRYFEECNDILQPANPGYTAWLAAFSEEPYYVLQCDFCYMISPAQFDEFVKPELAAAAKRLGNAFYHLDGQGQLPHLDSLLEIEEIDGIQWVPGDGSAPCVEWPEVYRKIHAAGKKIHLYGGPEVLETVADQIGSAEGILLILGASRSQESDVRAFLEKHGAKNGVD